MKRIFAFIFCLIVALGLEPLIAGPGQQSLLGHKPSTGGGSPSWIYPDGGAFAGGDLTGSSSIDSGGNAVQYTDISVPSAGTITKVSIYVGGDFNANTDVKIAILNSSFTQQGSNATATITSGDENTWKDVTCSISIGSASTVKLAYAFNGSFGGSIEQKYISGLGNTYYIDNPTTEYVLFYVGGYTWTSWGRQYAVRIEFTP